MIVVTQTVKRIKKFIVCNIYRNALIYLDAIGVNRLHDFDLWLQYHVMYNHVESYATYRNYYR